MNYKIATLNLCLGLKNKKEEVKRIINENCIDILCLQETEVETAYDHGILKIKNFSLELENNCIKARVGIYVGDSLNYVRRNDLLMTKMQLKIIII